MPPLIRLFLGTVALVALYFAVPISADRSLAVRAVLTTICLAVATWLIVLEVRHQIRSEGSTLSGLALAVVGGALAFAMTDYTIAHIYPDEFVGLETKLDGLYFALTTLATVGYGDVHAQGQVARAVVCIQLVFNLVVLTTAASVLVNQLRSRAASRSAGKQ
jgi:voltage-gated potassium channel